MSDTPLSFTKDPDAILDYSVDWTSWLGSDTISSVVWTVATGLTQVLTSNTGYVATIWLSGGTDGQSYDIICRITTAGGRTDDRTFTIVVRQR
jgi:hypothetical protein